MRPRLRRSLSSLVVAALLTGAGIAAARAEGDAIATGRREGGGPSAVPAPGESRPWRIVTSTPMGPDLSVGLEGIVAYRAGVGALVAGDPGAAATEFERSIAVRPDRTATHALLAVALLQAGSHHAIGEFPLAVRAFLADFEAQSRLAFNVLFAVACGVALLVIGGLIAPTLRALPLLAHEIAEALPRGLPRGVRGAYPIVLLAAPLYLWRPWVWHAGIVWSLFLLVVLTRRHLGRAERRLLGLAGLLGVTAPALLVLLGLLAAPAAPRSLAFAVARARDPFLREHAGRAIEASLEWKGDDVDLLYELALLRREEGRVQDAAELYGRVLSSKPDHPSARVNLGNIFLARGERVRALAEYREALDGAPSSASAHYDVGQVLLEDFDFGQAKVHLRKAASINFDFVQSLSRASIEGKETLLVDESPGAADHWRWLIANRKSLLQVTPREAFAFAAGWLLPPTRVGCALLALVFATAFAVGRLPRQAEPCTTCGTPVCRCCRVRLSRRDFCAACAAVARQDSAHDQLEAEKHALFRKAQLSSRVVALLLAMFVPGAGHLYVGRRALGRAMLFAAGVIAAVALTGGGPIEALPRFDGEMLAAMRPALALVLINLHLAGIVHFWMVTYRRLA